MNILFGALPKPIRFGLLGALGGLLGALLFGELLWWMLEPPPPPPPAAPSPRIAVSVSPSVGVYQDGKNTFAIDFDSDLLDGAPINVRFTGFPAEVDVAPITGAERGVREAIVTASERASLGNHRVTAVATASVKGETVTAKAEFEVRVEALPKPAVDVVFVLDVTESMGFAIDGVQAGIKAFADGLNPKRVDFRIGLLAFRDRVIGEENEVLKFGKEDDRFTTDLEEFKRKVSQLRAIGGGDFPESSLDGICEAAEYPFRPKATKVLLLITDAMPKLPDRRIRSMSEAADVLKAKNIEQLHIVSNPDERFRGDRKIRNTYESLWSKGGTTGQYFDLQQISNRRDSFNRLLPELSKVIATAAAAARPTDAQLSAPPPKPSLGAAQGLQSSREYDSSSTGRLVAAISIWTAAIAAAISLALGIGQFLSLNRKPSPGAIALVLAGGAVAGLVGGAVGQGLFALASGSSVLGVILRVVGWSALGGLAGSGLAFVVPNLRKAHGLVGGLLGGGLGAVGYLIASGIGLGDTLGRLAGALILGFFIGLMVALVEAALRRAWLEVRFGGGETITVNLGPEPVKVGGDGKQCAVWARGADPVALRYWVREGKVVCDESGSGEQTVGNGDRRTAGSVEVVVRMASGGPVTERPRSEAPPRAKPAAEPVPPKPMSAPVAKPAPRPAPVPPKPMSAPVAKPAPRPVSGPTCPECGAAVDKTHGVCPACGAMY